MRNPTHQNNQDDAGWSEESIQRQLGCLVSGKWRTVEWGGRYSDNERGDLAEPWSWGDEERCCCWHVCDREGVLWCCGGLCWGWLEVGETEEEEGGKRDFDGRVERGEGILGVDGVGRSGEVDVVSARVEESVKVRGRYRDDWECDFCGVECFCKYQSFCE
jgi:hypothetical protein